jgi:glycosyltransferase involved in cell wall biosynthesis
VTRFVCEGLAERGHQVHIVGWNTESESVPWRNGIVLPRGRDALGADVLPEYLISLRPDVLVTFGLLTWMTFVRHPTIDRILRTLSTRWVLYYPLDGDLGGDRLPRSWRAILNSVDAPVSMSDYGRRVSAANGISARYIPAGVDLRAFGPPSDRLAAKRAFGYDGKFVVLTDARNQHRKQLSRELEMFARFHRLRPDSILHLHTDPDDHAASRPEYQYSIKHDVAALGLARAVHFTDGFAINHGLALGELARLYQAADAHVLMSRGEGFGLPSLQAAATGAIPLAPRHSANVELVRGHGELLPVQHLIPNEYGILQAYVDIDETVGRLVRVHDDDRLREGKSARGIVFARRYNWGGVIDEWDRVLRTCLAEPARSRGDRALTTRHALTKELRATDVVGTALRSLPAVADGVVQVRAATFGALDVLLAADRSQPAIHVPTQPPDATTGKARRRTGLVLAIGLDATRVFQRLQAIFPGLVLHDLHPDPAGIAIDSGPRADDTAIASSILILNTVPVVRRAIAERAASFGTPCVGWSDLPGQELWPTLSAPPGGLELLFMRARRTLSDQAYAMGAIRAAQRLQVGAHSLLEATAN